MAGSAGACEVARLQALDQLDILDSPAIGAFDRVTRLVRGVFEVPIATLAFLDAHRQWFLSRQGIPVAELARGPSFCNYAIAGEDIFVVPDTAADPRFVDNPFVVGEPFLRFYAGMPIRTKSGHAVGTLCAMDSRPHRFSEPQKDTLRDLGGLVEEMLDYQLLANTDPLTGVLSRRAFREEASRAVALARRHGHQLGCIAIDLDHFKSVNDCHGHAAGDTVLIELVEICRHQLRESDILGRTGGEEFVCILPHAGPREAREVAERIRHAVAEHPFAAGGGLRVTASLGVATLDRAMTGIDALMEPADLALYRAKAAGRNRVDDGPARDLRAGDRTRVLKGGRIVFNGRMSTMDCTVRSLSEGGAGIDVMSSAGIPADFELMIQPEGITRPCHVVWKTDRKIGVEFR